MNGGDYDGEIAIIIGLQGIVEATPKAAYRRVERLIEEDCRTGKRPKTVVVTTIVSILIPPGK